MGQRIPLRPAGSTRNKVGYKTAAFLSTSTHNLLANGRRPYKGYEHSTLFWNLRRLYFYIENNAGTLVNYGMRYHKGLPISSSIAESAVNLVVSHRMAKKQQMRWTDEGAHCLAQVRVAVLNEEFSVEKLAVLTKTSAAENSPSARRAA